MFQRGSIVVATDPYGHAPRRPYLIVSDETHPFAGEQYIAAGITTKEYPPSISLEGQFVEGGLSERSFVSPWAIVSLREADIERAVAIVEQPVTRTAAERLSRTDRLFTARVGNVVRGVVESDPVVGVLGLVFLCLFMSGHTIFQPSIEITLVTANPTWHIII